MSTTRTIRIPIGGVSVQNVVGKHFGAIAASSDFYLSIDDAPNITVSQGRNVPSPDLNGFTKIVLTNPSASAALDLTFCVGDSPYQSSTLNTAGYQAQRVLTVITNYATFTRGGAEVIGATSNGQTYPGDADVLWGPPSGLRKQFIVTNTHATLHVEVGNSDGNLIGYVGPGETWRCDSDDFLHIWNPTASPITVMIGEVFQYQFLA